MYIGADYLGNLCGIGIGGFYCISENIQVIEAYIECPENELMQPFTDDKWGITDILRACDRRIGKRRLIQMHDETENVVVREIIEKRLR